MELRQKLDSKTLEYQLQITELFYSLQGESLFVGKPTVFIRTTGCNLRCTWCDTKYSYFGGTAKTFLELLTYIEEKKTPYVCVTGGEPLMQPRMQEFLDCLVGQNLKVSVETGGGVSTQDVPAQVSTILDLKCPDSGETGSMVWKNLEYLKPQDQVKFVIASERDFLWATQTLLDHKLAQKCTVLFSPAVGKMDPTVLAQKILDEKLPVTFQMQLHKILWGPKRGV